MLAPKITVGNKPFKSVDLLGTAKTKKPRRILRAVIVIIVVITLSLGGLAAVRAVNLSNKIFVGTKTSFFDKLRDVFLGSSGTHLLKGEDLGQVNVLLLGIGGEGHDGPYLSDTIILAQIRPDIGEITLTAIPRDFLAALPDGYGQQKINSAFAYGFKKNKSWDEAGQWSRSAVEKISGLTIPYFAVLDFAGFEQAINKVGGVDVTIDRTFTDYTYPDSGIGYLPPITFTAGPEHMNGTRALQFSRSRHAAGPEGSDFARSQRQQKIIESFKSNVLSLNLVSDAGKINSLLGIFADHFHTNISPGEIFRMYSIVKDHNIQKFLSLSLDPSTGLVCPEILEGNGAYVLTHCPGKTDGDVKNFFKNSFTVGKLYAEKSIVWMASSRTSGTQDYQEADKKLKSAGLTVWEVAFGKTNLPQTIVYQVNPKPATVEFIKNTLGATEVNLPPPGIKVDKSKVDIVVILGGDGN